MPVVAQSGGAVSPLTAVGAHGVTRPTGSIANPKSQIVNGFTLVEVMVVMGLMAFIVLALMAVFNSTQAAFKTSVTQTGVLEDGRATIDLMAADFRAMTPSYGFSSYDISTGAARGPVNFSVLIYDTFTNYPLIQPLVGSSPPQSRTNVLEEIYVLTRQNTTWTGVGYKVDLTSTNYLYPLYRYTMSTNVMAADPTMLFNYFDATPVTRMSHLLDGVVDLRARAYDPGGAWINSTWTNGPDAPPSNMLIFTSPQFGETGMYMRSNAVPAAVEIYLGVLEDRVLQHAESLAGNPVAQSNYLSSAGGQVHLFRQRVSIKNVDPSAYP